MSVDYTDEDRLRVGDRIRCLCLPTTRIGVVHSVAECIARVQIEGERDHDCERFERVERGPRHRTRTTEDMTTDKRDEYRRRMQRALLDGGRPPSETEWNELVAKARERAARQHERTSARLASADAATDSKPSGPLEILRPWDVAVHATVLLGLEVELAETLADRESAEQHRMELLALVSKSQVLRGPEDVDLFKLEDALLTGRGLPRNPEALLLEVVRELIRWRAAAGQVKPEIHGEKQP